VTGPLCKDLHTDDRLAVLTHVRKRYTTVSQLVGLLRGVEQ
jgi:hypothetical protein